MPEPWWNVEQLAEWLGKKVSWIEDQCAGADSTFPHHRVGRDLRFSPGDRELIDEQTAAGRGRVEAEQAANAAVLERALAGVAKRRRSKSTAAAAAR